MKVLATLLLLLQLGPLAGPVLCHVQMYGMPQHSMVMGAPHNGAAGMPHGDCSTIQFCTAAPIAVVPALARVEPALQPHSLVLPTSSSLIAGLRAAPPAPPPRA